MMSVELVVGIRFVSLICRSVRTGISYVEDRLATVHPIRLIMLASRTIASNSVFATISTLISFSLSASYRSLSEILF